MLDVAEPPTETEPDSDASVLAPVTVAVERERRRLSATADRGPIVALLVGGWLRMRHLGTDESAQSGRRYLPVVWTVIGIVVLSALLPGRLHVAGPTQEPALASPVTTPTVTVPSTPVTTPISDPVIPAVEDVPVVAPPSDRVVPYTPPPVAPTDDFVGTQGSTFDPLHVIGFGWASSLAGTPLGAQNVPDGSMPVGNRIGRIDKATFVRLAGSSSSKLELVQDPDGTREALGAAAVMACPILTGDWQEKPEQSFDNAPTWSIKGCVTGVKKGDTWTFDLSSFADRTGQNGFALVPAADAPADFQIAFKPAAS